MDLRPFAPALAADISSWATSTDEVSMWCSRTDVPVPADVIVGWSDPPDVDAFVLEERADVVAYGELWIDDVECEVELARLIVAPRHRGRGVGRRFVALLTDVALRHHPFVVMRVHPDNEAAQRCYAAAGFERASRSDEHQWNQGQPLAFVWMVRGRS